MINDNVILNHLLHDIHQMILVRQMFKAPNVKVAVLDEIVNALERVLWVSRVSITLSFSFLPLIDKE